MTSDHRRNPRIPVTLLVEHQAGPMAPRHVDYVENVSRSGLFIRTQTKTPEGGVLSVTFSPQRDARLVQAYARVVRTTPNGMGAEFLQMDSDSAQLLSAIA